MILLGRCPAYINAEEGVQPEDLHLFLQARNDNDDTNQALPLVGLLPPKSKVHPGSGSVPESCGRSPARPHGCASQVTQRDIAKRV